MSNIRPSFILVGALSLTGCANLTPDYSRPIAPVNGVISETKGTQSALIQLKAWQEFFPDVRVKELISLSLEYNRDLRIATANVAQAEGLFQIQRTLLLPSVDASGSIAASNGATTLTSGNNATVQNYTTSIGFTSYEIDFWGRVSSLNAGALATYYATLEAQRSSKLNVIASTASAYIDWLSAKESLDLADQTLTGRENFYELMKLRESIGIASNLDLAQAEVAQVTVEAQRAKLIRALVNARAKLELLVGTPLDVILNKPTISKIDVLKFHVPKNLSSQIILSRPDIMEAEELLISSNANIYAARAAFLPQISLNGNVGLSSQSLGELFSSNASVWSFGPSINIPIFDNGRQANLDVAKALQERNIAQYEKAIQVAFFEIYTEFEGRKARKIEVHAIQRLVKAEQRRLSLAQARYNAGLSSYFEVLDSQQNLFTAQQSLIESQRGLSDSVIELYRALGGGDGINSSFRDRNTNNVPVPKLISETATTEVKINPD